jgi:hypothetical protein
MTYRVFLFLLTFLPLADTLGQSTSTADFIRCIDLQYGPDNLLINGRTYRPDHPRAEGHPFFQTEEWKSGVVYIKGNSFPARYLKYDLFNHHLLIKHERPNGSYQEVVLSDLLVDSFLIEEHLFVQRDQILSDKENSGYLEKLFEDQLSFFRFQTKVFGSVSNSTPYGRFSDLKDVFYLLDGDQLHKITNKKDFLNCFPARKSQIKKYMNNQSLKWKKMTNNQFAQLLQFCHEQG